MVTIAASRAWAVSMLRWRSWMSDLLIVDAHLGVAARLCYLDKGAELCCLHLDLVLVLVVWGLQWWQTLKGPSLVLRSTISWAANGTCLALYMERTSSLLGASPNDRMSIAASEGESELLERKIWLRCCSGGSNAWVRSGNDGYAFPGRRKGRARVETSTVSRTLEVERLVLVVACAGSQRPAPGASLPEVHEELTGCGRHLLWPETDLLTPPPPS